MGENHKESERERERGKEREGVRERENEILEKGEGGSTRKKERKKISLSTFHQRV